MTKKTKQKRVTKKMSKSALIRSMPDAPAKQIVEEGKKRKLNFTERYVYAIRSNAKAKTKLTKRTKRAYQRKSVDTGTATFRSLLAEIGLARAREVMAELQRDFGA